MYTIYFLLSILFIFAITDILNKRTIPHFYLLLFIPALMLSTNVKLGLISLSICLLIAFISWLISLKVGLADWLEIGLITLIKPTIQLAGYGFPTILPLAVLLIIISQIINLFLFKKETQPLALAIGLSMLILLI